MKVLAAVILIVTSTITTYVAAAADQNGRPAGVEARNWIQISDRLGFVVDEKAAAPAGNQSRQILLAPPEAVSADLMPPAKGYFVVKTQAGWRRVVISEPSELAG